MKILTRSYVIIYIAIFISACFDKPENKFATTKEEKPVEQEVVKKKAPFVYCNSFKFCADLIKYEKSCRVSKNQSDCKEFVKIFQTLAVVGDCKRKFDSEPVPSVWLCDESPIENNYPKIFERSARTLSELKQPYAKKFYKSKAFRSILDGDVAEQHR